MNKKEAIDFMVDLIPELCKFIERIHERGYEKPYQINKMMKDKQDQYYIICNNGEDHVTGIVSQDEFKLKCHLGGNDYEWIKPLSELKEDDGADILLFTELFD